MKNYLNYKPENLQLQNIAKIKTIKSNVSIHSFKDYYTNIADFLTKNERTFLNQIILIKDGYGDLWIDIHKYKVVKQSVFIYRQDQLQRLENINNIEGTVLIFPTQLLYKCGRENELIQNLNEYNTFFQNPKIKLNNDEFNSICEIIEKIKYESFKVYDQIQESIIESTIRILLLKLIQMNSNEVKYPFMLNVDNNVFIKFKNLLDKYFSQEKSVLFYAMKLFVTPNKLNQIVKKNISKTAKQMIEERILLETKRHLIHSNFSIKEIGYLVGFNDPTNFNKFFKKNTKQTPVEYRESSI
ncbi:MAG: helix-turn-helix domain-containing protein [Ignavibacteriae bacterium]|nr:helix-turn-helix domain-containing protein [Ignavibacteriota bacterium]